MEKLIFVPIERLEERYSVQWYKWFMDAFAKLPVEIILVGDDKPRTIKQGQFLDVYDTNVYKLRQMQEIVQCLETYPDDDITIFFMDAWFTGLEALAYIRSCTKRRITIKGMVHAGTWDKWDFLHQQNCQKWAKDFERSLFKIYDEVFCATEFHQNMIEEYFGEKFDNITLVDYPVIDPAKEADLPDKENIVVFPHRLAKEKQPEMFDAIAEHYRKKFPGNSQLVTFVKSKDVCKTKDDYYKLLARSKVSVSTALQETFGIAMLESFHLGCFPVVPDRLSYRETFAPMYRYESLEQAADLIHVGLTCKFQFSYKYGSEIKWAKQILKGAPNVSLR